MIKLNFEETYVPSAASPDYMNYTFASPQRDGTTIEIVVEIREIAYPLLPNVFNVGFGPSDGNARFLNNVSLRHADSGKVFSTIVALAIIFLQKYPGATIGLDGSDTVRAYLYHRMFQTNYIALENVVLITGVDWYTKLLRNGDIERERNGSAVFRPRAEAYDLGRKNLELYRYYLVRLR